MKKFYIETQQFVDHAFTVVDGMVNWGEKVEVDNRKIFNLVGNGGAVYCMYNTLTTSYKFKDVIDMSNVTQGLNRSIIIINDVMSYGKVCIIKLSKELQGIIKRKYIKLEELNKQEYAASEKLDNRGLLSRGIDPMGKTWYCMVIYNIEMSKEEWLAICEFKVKVMLADCYERNL